MPKGEGKEAVIQRILKAALEVFAEKGFSAATVDDIASRAGVNKAMLYYYLGDKQELFSRTVLSAITPVEKATKQIVLLQTPVSERLMQLQAAFAQALASNSHLPRLMLRMLVTELEHIPPEVLQAMAQVFRVIRQLVAEGVRVGHLRPANPWLVHLLLLGSLGLAWEASKLLDRLRQLGLLEEAPQGLAKEQLAAELWEILLYGISLERSE
ncbi:MAG: TetR/AcrR family transcriptional regulator [Thermoanaerobaculum sp.]